MRYSREHKEETRVKVTSGAGRAFRKHGFAGVGVDGLAKEAGVTSGGFYSHFDSKDEAFHAAVVLGMEELLTGIRRFRQIHGPAWFAAFSGWYLGKSHRADLACGCALVTLSPEVVRADMPVRQAYAAVYAQIVDEIADGLTGGTLTERKDRARVILSVLQGATTTARAMPDEASADLIASAALKSIRQLAGI